MEMPKSVELFYFCFWIFLEWVTIMKYFDRDLSLKEFSAWFLLVSIAVSAILVGINYDGNFNNFEAIVPLLVIYFGAGLLILFLWETIANLLRLRTFQNIGIISTSVLAIMLGIKEAANIRYTDKNFQLYFLFLGIIASLSGVVVISSIRAVRINSTIDEGKTKKFVLSYTFQFLVLLTGKLDSLQNSLFKTKQKVTSKSIMDSVVAHASAKNLPKRNLHKNLLPSVKSIIENRHWHHSLIFIVIVLIALGVICKCIFEIFQGYIAYQRQLKVANLEANARMRGTYPGFLF